jgi:two-component system response regulator RegX3
VQLPRKQFQLLELLMANAGQVLPKALIVRRLWSLGEVPDSNSLAVQISRLRQMIEDDPVQPRRIRTVRGLGYTFVDAIGGSARD